MLKIKIAGRLPLLGYLSLTPLKPVEIAGDLPFIDSAFSYRICSHADVGRKEHQFSHPCGSYARLIELKQL